MGIDYEAWGTSRQKQLKLMQFYIRVIPQAIKFLQQSIAQYGGHIGEFYKYNKLKIDFSVNKMTLDEMITMLTDEEEYELEEFEETEEEPQ